MNVVNDRLRSALLSALLVFGAAIFGDVEAAAAPVVLQLDDDPQFRFAGYYAALWQGYYADAGLDVEIRSDVAPGGVRREATAEVAAGRATFGIGAGDILVAGDRGAPLVIIASIFPTDSRAFYALAASGIAGPCQMVGRRVVRMWGDPLDAALQTMLHREGVRLNDIVDAPPEGIVGLAEGRIDVAAGDRLTTPFYARSMGLALTEIRPEVNGSGFYGDSLFTHADLVQREPKLVDDFRKASLRGWRYAVDHHEELAQRIAAEFPRELIVGDVASLNAFQAEQIVATLGDAADTLGHINVIRWRRMQEELALAGIVQSPFLPDAAFFTAADAITRELVWWRRLAHVTAALALAALILPLAAYAAWLRQRVRRDHDLLERSRWQLAMTVDAAREGLFEWWPDTDLLRCDWGRDAKADGRSGDGVGLTGFLRHVHPADRARLDHTLRTLAEGGSGDVEIEFRVGDSDDAAWFLLRCGVPPPSERGRAVFGVLLEITRRKLAEQAMERLAMQDPLTGLGNRRCFDDALARAMARVDRDGGGVVVALVDLDDFKPINDRFGHDRGDEVLRVVAKRLLRLVRASDVAVRFGGDEFAVVVEGMVAADVEPWADRILHELSRPMVAAGQVMRVGASLGWTRYPDDAATAASLVRHADAALYSAKRAGGGRHAAFPAAASAPIATSRSPTLRRA